jgi:hypothetical protein
MRVVIPLLFLRLLFLFHDLSLFLLKAYSHHFHRCFLLLLLYSYLAAEKEKRPEVEGRSSS